MTPHSSTTDSLQTARLSPRFIEQLGRIVGRSFVLTSPAERLVYESDACLLMNALPDVIVLPHSTVEVAAIVRACRKEGVPYIARGAGTGLSGGALAVEGGVIIGLSRMNRIVELYPDQQLALVQVGIVNAQLNEILAEDNLFYAPDPSSQGACTLGGNIAENAGGIHCLKYGVTADHILGVEVVWPDGTISWTGGTNRRGHGLNWTGLLVGSEGTLGIVTQAWIKLLPKPTDTQVFLLSFEKLAQATQCVSDIIASGLTPAAMEFMDRFTIQAVNQAFSMGFSEHAEAMLLIELDGDTQQVAFEAEHLKQLLETVSPLSLTIATEESERKKLWAARKGAVAAYGRILPAFYLHDCVIPRRKLTEVLLKIEAITQEHDVVVGNVFHAGDGNLHPNILFDPDDATMVERVIKAGEAILTVCLDVGGVLSGEHGIGIEKSAYMDRQFSPLELTLMKHIKQACDPEGLANPGKIFPTRKGCGETHAAFDAIANPLLASGQAWI